MAAFDRHVDVHESAIESFVDLGGPEGAIEMYPLVSVHIEQTSFAVRRRVATRRTKDADTPILHGERGFGIAVEFEEKKVKRDSYSNCPQRKI